MLTRVVNLLGFRLGTDLLGAHACNISGLWENEQVVALNDQLLDQLGSIWYDHRILSLPQPGDSEFEQIVGRVMQVLEQQFSTDHDIAIKDPRICKLLPFYQVALERLGYQTEYLFAIRDPQDVATSLYRRDGIPRAIGLAIWCSSVLESLPCVQGREWYGVNYDGMLEDGDKAINGLLRWLISRGMKKPSKAALQAVREHINPGERHARQAKNSLVGMASVMSDLTAGIYQPLVSGQVSSSQLQSWVQQYLEHVPVFSRAEHKGTAEFCCVSYLAADDAIERLQQRAGHLVLKDGHESDEDTSIVDSEVLSGRVTLFYNHLDRGESQSLLRGLSLVTNRNALLLTTEAVAHLSDQNQSGLSAALFAGREQITLWIKESNGQEEENTDSAFPVVTAIYIPAQQVACIDPWDLINETGTKESIWPSLMGELDRSGLDYGVVTFV